MKRNVLSLLVFATFALIALNCATAPKPAPLTPKDSPNLTKTEAMYRGTQVKNVHYDLTFDLSEKKETFSGSSTIRFDLEKKGEGVRVDFHDGTVESVQLNGTSLPMEYNGHYVWLKEDKVKSGRNEVVIKFSHKFSNDGSGLHRFVDPKDQKIYTYSDLEPFDANKIFPSFDQPNIKATYAMTVKAPKDWIVITSVRENGIDSNEDGSKTWKFPKSAKFSTYIWSLHAGPYTMWEDKFGDIPLRLFARQSLAPYVKYKDWFKFTKEGFEFFNTYFAYPYPYIKYDQVIVPEFNAGAMENVAAVTFTERFVKRGEKTRAQRRSLSNVILHEMAHMWFGNLVTMDWWNDLWLNESFATYMATLAQAENSEFKDEAWRSFNGTKGWALWEDQLVTTHPIEAVVPDTTQAFANFDGITYGKGASVLKQISYLIGPENFQKGVQNYFKKHAEKNTTLADFMAALSEASGRDLKQWQKEWLQTAGVNTVGAEFTCKEGKVETFSLRQTAPDDHSYLRTQSVQVALLTSQSGELKVNDVFKVEISGSTTPVNAAKGKDCPQVVYPNYNDHGYLKVKLDPVSLGTLKDRIAQVNDPFLRQMFWSSLWDMVVFAELNFQAYGEMLLTGSLRNETDEYILQSLQRTLTGWGGVSSPSVLNFYTLRDGKDSKAYRDYASRLERLLWSRLRQAKAGSELQKILYQLYVDTASTETGLNRLKSLLDGKTNLRGLRLDQDRRWGIVSQLARYQYSGVEKIITAEKKKDPSHSGVQASISSQALIPNWEIKRKWINEYLSDKSNHSFANLRAAIYSLFPVSQNDLRQKYASEFFPNLKKLNDEKEPYVASTFTTLAPNECVNGSPGSIEKFIETHQSQLKAPVLKKLKILDQEFERCRNALNLSKTSKQFSN